jgi:IS605 OrfB family transposase
MKATRIAYSKNLNKGKFNQLTEQAKRLGRVRTEIWQRFGSISGVGVKDRTIRDQWIKEKRNFAVLANPWKEILRDTMANIAMTVEAAKVSVRRAVGKHAQDSKEQKRLFTSLKSNTWIADKYLSRKMRKHWKRGHNHTNNQIIVRSDNYTVFELGGKLWIKIPSLIRGRPIAIPLNTTVAPTGTLRLILRNGAVEVHYAIDVTQTNDCGERTIGVDKGYTEVLTDSDGEHHGEGLGKLLTEESDYLKAKYVRRNKLKAVVDKLRQKNNPAKADGIVNNNLGRKKLNARANRNHKNIKTIVFNAVHRVADKACHIVSEDLTAPMAAKKIGKNVNRRLSSWTKGVIAKALENVSQRRGSTLHYVNPAYTSQMDSKTCLLEGRRVGDKFYRENGEVIQADVNAARNVLARLHDPEIDRWTPYKKVKSILLKRTESHRLSTAQPGL